MISKNINKIIEEKIDEARKAILLDGEYGDSSQEFNEIAGFLSMASDFDKRQNKAKEIIEKILRHHGKQKLLSQIELLAIDENTAKKILKRQRDHVVHSLLCHLLGLAINVWTLEKKADFFEWKLASLLHDIAYPVEIGNNIADSFGKNINRIKKVGTTNKEIRVTTKIEGLENLFGNVCSLDLIQNRLAQWDLDIDVTNSYKKMQDSRPCHGMYGATAFLNVVDDLYQEKNPQRKRGYISDENNNVWSQDTFENEIVSVASSIFLHNLNKDFFSKKKIVVKKSYTAFLLRLCDTLQEWERPYADPRDMIPADAFSLELEKGKVILKIEGKYALVDALQRKVDEVIEGCKIVIMS
jgi:hypothetical protein